MALSPQGILSVETLDGSDPDPPEGSSFLEPEAEHHTDIILLGSSEPSELSSPASPGPSRELIAYEVKVNERNIEGFWGLAGLQAQALRLNGVGPVAEENTLETYKTVPVWKREPVRVLSLFGDIRNELTSLGFLEPGSDPGRLKHLDDATDVVRRDVEGWGPFDLVYGSTPPVGHACDHPPVWYLLQFHRVLQYARPRPARQQPFFWMFVDNLVLTQEDRTVATRFLEADPVTIQDICGRTIQNVNAVHVWSNIPAVRSKHSALVSQEALFSLAQDRRRMKPPAQGPAKLVKNCFLPLREYFKCFSTGLTSSL
ncbi:DNA (cytosine-5)-methyltransferase 3-like [Puma concolor]|uniref:DNA (Cytosine-5)-methyltransferase 3-like n=1 Tax=Puma concolor TaxID=9696 RepID=A0A6P6GZI9_PUMCO|nr:DNA (cytosine-5)-methyltransferase 3-like [Puma concolor]